MVDALDVKGCVVCDPCDGCFVESMLSVELRIVGSFSVVERKETFTGGSVIPLVEWLVVLLISENTNGLL